MENLPLFRQRIILYFIRNFSILVSQLGSTLSVMVCGWKEESLLYLKFGDLLCFFGTPWFLRIILELIVPVVCFIITRKHSSCTESRGVSFGFRSARVHLFRNPESTMDSSFPRIRSFKHVAIPNNEVHMKYFWAIFLGNPTINTCHLSKRELFVWVRYRRLYFL